MDTTTEFKPSTKTVEQIIKDQPGQTAKEITWKFVKGDETPDDKTRTTVAAILWQLVTRKNNAFNRSKDGSVMRYYGPESELPKGRALHGAAKATRDAVQNELAKAGIEPGTQAAFEHILGKAAQPVENVEKRTHQDAPEPSEAPKMDPTTTIPSPNAATIQRALEAYVWDTGADVKPLHDFMDWYELHNTQ